MASFIVMVRNPKGEMNEIKIEANEASIGKASDNAIVLQGWNIGKKHAILRKNGANVFIEDKGSMIGSMVNGERITGHGPLKSSDEIRIAGYTLFVYPGQGGGAQAVANDQVLNKMAGELAAVSEVKAKREGQASKKASNAPMVASEPKEEKKTEEENPFKDEEGPSFTQEQKEEYFTLRKRLQQELLRHMDLRRTDVSRMSEAELRKNTTEIVQAILDEWTDLPSFVERDRLITDVLAEALGLGPLEELIADESISEIMVNASDEIFIERKGRIVLSEITFTSDQAVLSAIERIVTPLGRRIDEQSPLVDARLKDGSRVNAVIPPIALKGPCISIRKFMKKRLTGQDLVKFGSMDEDILEFLMTAVEKKQNVVISGGTGSGKTTLLNVLSNFIPQHERVVTVEDAAELKLYQPNLVSLEARPPNVEGKGAVPIRELVKNCLRMRPDRIVVGECRGGEALDMLQAMNTGHDGSLTTGHANSPRDMLARLEVMVMMSGMDLPLQAIREQIASAVNIIVQQTRFSCGTRKITYVCEVTGVESNTIQLQDIFLYHQTGYDENGKIEGHHAPTGSIPEFYQDLRRRGIHVNLSIFGDEDEELR